MFDRNGSVSHTPTSVALDAPGFMPGDGFDPRQPVAEDLSAPDQDERIHEKVSARVVNQASRIMRNEGPRGYSSRASIMVKYATYFLGIVFSVIGVKAAFAGVPGVSDGGKWLLLSVTAQMLIAALGTMFFSDRRHEIIHQVRAFVFGYTATPAVGIAIFARVAWEMSTSSQDLFISTLVSALPWIWFLPVLLPVVIFGRLVAGMRAVHRLGRTGEELLDSLTGNVSRPRTR